MDENNRKREWWELPPIEPSIPATGYQVSKLLSELDACIGGVQPLNETTDDSEDKENSKYND